MLSPLNVISLGRSVSSEAQLPPQALPLSPPSSLVQPSPTARYDPSPRAKERIVLNQRQRISLKFGKAGCYSLKREVPTHKGSRAGLLSSKVLFPNLLNLARRSLEVTAQPYNKEHGDLSPAAAAPGAFLSAPPNFHSLLSVKGLPTLRHSLRLLPSPTAPFLWEDDPFRPLGSLLCRRLRGSHGILKMQVFTSPHPLPYHHKRRENSGNLTLVTIIISFDELAL